MESIKNGLVQPANYITHKVTFSEVATQFESLLDPNSKVVKAVVVF
jgi:threonine dehydrogenase-like Zn-dependent dehydrogenase